MGRPLKILFLYYKMLKLYTYSTCPYCEKVRQAFAAMKIDYQEVDADYGSTGQEELLRLGGKQQVPFLADEDHGVFMYESNDIISYAETNLKKN